LSYKQEVARSSRHRPSQDFAASEHHYRVCPSLGCLGCSL